MNVLPFKQMTIVVPYRADEVWTLLDASILRPKPHENNLYFRRTNTNPLHKFSGAMYPKKDYFEISPSVIYSQSYIPLIRGTVDGSRTGAIVRLSFRPLPGTLLIGSIAIIITTLTSAILVDNAQYMYAIGVITFFLISYSVALINFNMHSRKSYEMFCDIFDLN